LAKMELSAALISREGQTGVVEFSWKGGEAFSRVLEECGQVPIPPYLNRDTEAIDLERYQTLYAHVRGSVAAPTAGLHFTEAVLEAIRAKSIDTQNVCLHVGAGTFLPVKTSHVSEHPMHREPFSISLSLLEELRDSGRKCIAVGTTSVRTLESLYYAGVSILEKGEPEDVAQWAPYERPYNYSTEEAIKAIIDYLDKKGLEELKAGTRIIIVPGFKFRLVDILVTNFHQPESTLILLVSAFVGGDWRTIYDYALANGFRFLSYGDSSLLFRVDK
ncbi:MAG: S-adenosylmethionine:tRNA ribosyltransferase-isomerase, partial [Bacteroidales bacterium]|nr:S-adenosylmethionine:tRNA ribosyltransferase-isomerase [Bacteroidales bacterium]